MSKKKKNFVEPDGGWFHHPNGDMCMSCPRLLDNCSHLEFHKMRPMDTYEGTKIVKCTEYVHGPNPWTESRA